MTSIAITAYQGRAGDRNDRAVPGAAAVAAALAERWSLSVVSVGAPQPALATRWDVELAAARPDLERLAATVNDAMQRGRRPLTALPRCAAALATLPVIARQRPDVCVVWLDAHADLNTPQTTGTGYLGGMALAGPAGRWASGLGAGVSLAHAVLVGVRDVDPAEQHVIDTSGLTLVRVSPHVAVDLRQAIVGRPVYVHVDCDVLEPGSVPTEFSVPGGLTLEQLHQVAAVLADREVVGVEIAEFEHRPLREGQPPASPASLLDALAPLWRALQRP